MKINIYSVRTRILILISLSVLMLIFQGLVFSNKSSSFLQEKSKFSRLSIDLVKLLEINNKLSLQQSVEFERGFLQVSIARAVVGSSTEPVNESFKVFNQYTNNINENFTTIKEKIMELPDTDLKYQFNENINIFLTNQQMFLSSAEETYNFWVQLNTMKASKPRREAEEKLFAMNESLAALYISFDDYIKEVDQSIESQQNLIFNSLLIGTVVSSIIFILVGWLITNSIFTPLFQAISISSQIAKGELRVNQISRKRKNEIGLLEESIDILSLKMREVIQDFHQSSHYVSNETEKLDAITNKTLLAVQQQVEETKEVSVSLSEINASSLAVAQMVDKMQAITQVSGDLTRTGEANFERTVQIIQNLASDIEHSSNVIDTLQTNTQEISSILGVISNISEQTNLLALNAAIEAARAGEQGRGFAVVADEVRQLAKNTQQATQKIEVMIAQLKAGTESAVKAMRTSFGNSKDAVANILVEEASLKKIRESIHEIELMNHRINDLFKDQNEKIQNANGSIHNIDNISQNTRILMNNVSESGHNLVKLSDELINKIAYFKV